MRQWIVGQRRTFSLIEVWIYFRPGSSFHQSPALFYPFFRQCYVNAEAHSWQLAPSSLLFLFQTDLH